MGKKKVVRTVATQWTEKEEEEDIVEWDCPPELQPTKPEAESGL